jgi:hypothetical protein
MGKAERAHQTAMLEQMGTGDALYRSYSSLHPVFEEAESSNLLHYFSRVFPVGCVRRSRNAPEASRAVRYVALTHPTKIAAYLIHDPKEASPDRFSCL